MRLLYAAIAATTAIAAGLYHVEAGHTMDTVIDFLLHALVVLGVIVSLRFVEGALRRRVGPDRSIETIQRRVDDLERQLESEREAADSEIRTLKAQVALLTSQWQETLKHLGVLEQKAQALEVENERLRSQLPVALPVMPPFPLLHIWGDPEFGQEDRIMLNRARVRYRTMESATREKIKEEFQRRREDGTPYWWVLVSAHGSKEGVNLEDGVAPPWWWNQVIPAETRLVIFANCEGLSVGDALAGVARRVIVMDGSIPSDDASAFVLAILRSKMAGLDVDQAFMAAIRQAPHISAYVDMRSA